MRAVSPAETVCSGTDRSARPVRPAGRSGRPGQGVGRGRFPSNVSWMPFVLPGLALFAIFELYPLLQAVLLSLYSWDGYSPKVFVGAANYLQVFSDRTFWTSLGHAGLYGVGAVTGKIVLGLGVALLLHRKIKGQSFYRSVVFAPVLMSFVAVGLLWQLIYSPQQGLFNALLRAIGFDGDVSWLGDPRVALWSLVIVDIWKFTGYHAILFLAGLTLVQPELEEAAAVDGAGPARRFWHITLPALRPIMTVNLVIASAGALNTFDLVYVMTGGGPYGVTEVPISYLYRVGFTIGQLGYASALACVMFVIVAIVTVIILRLQRGDAEEAA